MHAIKEIEKHIERDEGCAMLDLEAKDMNDVIEAFASHVINQLGTVVGGTDKIISNIKERLASRHHQLESSKRKKKHFREKVDKKAESCSVLVR